MLMNWIHGARSARNPQRRKRQSNPILKLPSLSSLGQRQCEKWVWEFQSHKTSYAAPTQSFFHASVHFCLLFGFILKMKTIDKWKCAVHRSWSAKAFWPILSLHPECCLTKKLYSFRKNKQSVYAFVRVSLTKFKWASQRKKKQSFGGYELQKWSIETYFAVFAFVFLFLRCIELRRNS